jgi:hypothetical protein
MRVITNKIIVRNRARTVWGLGAGGVLMMILGGVYLFTGRSPTTVMSLLVGGLVVGNIGVYLGRRWIRNPRPEVALKTGLKNLSDRYVLYNYVLPVPHVLLAPRGLFVLQPRREYGDITCEGDRWLHKKIWQRAFLEMDPNYVGNPFRKLRKDIDKLKRFLETKLPGEDIPVSGAVVFINPEARVSAIDSTFPVAEVAHLGRAIEAAQRDGERMNRHQRKEVERFLESLVP